MPHRVEDMPPVRGSSRGPDSTGNTTSSRNGASQAQSDNFTMTNGAQQESQNDTVRAQANHAGPSNGFPQDDEDETQTQTNDTSTPLTNDVFQSEADETQTQTDYTSTLQTNNVYQGQQHGLQQQPQPRLNLGRNEYGTPDKMVYYVCAACNTTGGFRANEALRCHKCGGVTMHKPRIKGYVFSMSCVRGAQKLTCFGYVLGSSSIRPINPRLACEMG